MTTYHDIRQGSDEWMELRCGRITGTSAAALLVNGKSENGLGAGAISLIYRKLAERVTGPDYDTPTNKWMDRGTALEPYARKEYENETFTEVQEIGFISSGDFFGYSPDGLVGDDGMIEIKCPDGTKFVRFSLTREIDKAHMAQMQWGLLISGRRWCDYVMYHPDFPQSLIIERVEADKKIWYKMTTNANAWENEMKLGIEKLGIE